MVCLGTVDHEEWEAIVFSRNSKVLKRFDVFVECSDNGTEQCTNSGRTGSATGPAEREGPVVQKVQSRRSADFVVFVSRCVLNRCPGKGHSLCSHGHMTLKQHQGQQCFNCFMDNRLFQ